MKLVSVYVFFTFCVLCSFGWLVNASTVAEYYTNLKMNGTNEVKETVDYEEFPDYNTESIVDNKDYSVNGTNRTMEDSGKNETKNQNNTDSEYSNKTNQEDKKEKNYTIDEHNKNNQSLINNNTNISYIGENNETKKDINPIEPYDSGKPSISDRDNTTHTNLTNSTDIIHPIIPKENNTNGKTPNDTHNNSKQKKKKSHIKKLNKELTSQIFDQFLKYTNQLISEKPPQKEIPKNDTSTIIITSSTNTTINTKKEISNNSHNVISIKLKHPKNHLRSF